jgi:uncharacterized protein (TIGR03083 family)
MERSQIFAATTAERLAIATLLEGLTAEEAAMPSLCAGWDIRTVAAHLVSTTVDGTLAFVWLAARRGSLARAVDELARRRATASVPSIVAQLREHAIREVSPPLVGPLDPFTDVLVHAGDIRIPLGLPFEPDPDRTNAALDFLTGPITVGFVPRGRLRGIELRATDTGRAWGKGAEVHGPAPALMMVACGRPALLGDLGGPGLATLRERLHPPVGRPARAP